MMGHDAWAAVVVLVSGGGYHRSKKQEFLLVPDVSNVRVLVFSLIALCGLPAGDVDVVV